VFSTYNGACVGIIPPKIINKNRYICDAKFHLDDVMNMYDDNVLKIGICLVSGKECRLYLIETNGKHRDIKLLFSNTEHLLKHHNKGGQSAQRFGRIRENNYNRYVKDLCDTIVKHYMKNNNTEYIIDKIVICGPTDLKKEIKDNELIQKYFLNKILKIMSTETIDDYTIQKVLEEIEEDISGINNDINIDEMISKTPDMFVFGTDEVYKYMLSGDLKTVYVSDKMFDSNMHKLNSKTEIIKCNNKSISIYGGIIGEKYYVQPDFDDIDFDIENSESEIVKLEKKM
jgi:peptide chain release factor subunit 1